MAIYKCGYFSEDSCVSPDTNDKGDLDQMDNEGVHEQVCSLSGLQIHSIDLELWLEESSEAHTR